MEVNNTETVTDPSGESLVWHSDYPLFWRTVGHVIYCVREWLWEHGGKQIYWETKLRRPPITKWWIRWCNPGFDPCEVCGYNYEWGEHNGWFQFERGGEYFGGEYTVHWFEGTQTCPRCRAIFSYGDSD